jgi:hypothetical protein
MKRHFYSLLVVVFLSGAALADDKPAKVNGNVNPNANVNANANPNPNANGNANPNPNANTRRGPTSYPGSIDSNQVPLRSAITPTQPSPTTLP